MAHANSRPGKIVCVGRNYARHAAELGSDVPSEPLIFLKPPSAVIAAGEPVRMPPDVGRVDYEGEIGLVVGRRCRRVSEAAAWAYLSGVVAVNDVTARTLQNKDSQWTRAKGLDTFCPVGNVVEASSVDPAALSVTTRVNGDVRQHGTTGEMVFSISRLVSFISHVMTLEAGDLIATGTPEGVGPVAPGDVVEVSLSCGSSVRNPVEGGEALGLGG
jgi:2-keto-4-pentenoate hydratase/2-oxohepta-3-ene-1,7-dioic acid hydratase in catechol pathway